LVLALLLTIAAAGVSPLLAKGEPYAPKSVSIVDGDTLKVDGVNVRISNLDTPERGSRAECDAERFLAVQASIAAETLIVAGVTIWPEGRADKYDRPLVRVSVNGVDWAEKMISASLAVPWEGRQHDWCGSNDRR